MAPHSHSKTNSRPSINGVKVYKRLPLKKCHRGTRGWQDLFNRNDCRHETLVYYLVGRTANTHWMVKYLWVIIIKTTHHISNQIRINCLAGGSIFIKGSYFSFRWSELRCIYKRNQHCNVDRGLLNDLQYHNSFSVHFFLVLLSRKVLEDHKAKKIQ